MVSVGSELVCHSGRWCWCIHDNNSLSPVPCIFFSKNLTQYQPNLMPGARLWGHTSSNHTSSLRRPREGTQISIRSEFLLWLNKRRFHAWPSAWATSFLSPPIVLMKSVIAVRSCLGPEVGTVASFLSWSHLILCWVTSQHATRMQPHTEDT